MKDYNNNNNTLLACIFMAMCAIICAFFALLFD